ncbi:MAG TPA: hypothetical protein VFN76_11435, partial [Candidatus Limnocylindria bacterium]|nr:hypothetical protein [Candidatus Limnocylindria bacterium]
MATTTTRPTTTSRPTTKSSASSNGNGHHSPELQYAPLGREVQPFEEMRTLPIGLDERARASSCELLNEILA